MIIEVLVIGNPHIRTCSLSVNYFHAEIVIEEFTYKYCIAHYVGDLAIIKHFPFTLESSSRKLRYLKHIRTITIFEKFYLPTMQCADTVFVNRWRSSNYKIKISLVNINR